jgi:beta-alanine degradation protein BauB
MEQKLIPQFTVDIKEVPMIRVALVVAVLVAMVTPALAQDPVKVAAKNYSVVFENDQVRVLRAVLGPGDKTPPHDHPATVVVPLSEGAARFTVDGKSQEMKMTGGTPLWIGAEKHAVENIGKTKTEVIIVELKSKK